MMTVIAVIVWIWSSYLNGFTTEAGYKILPPEKVELVEKVAKQFKSDKNRNGSCTLDGKPASLEWIMLAKIANESSYGLKWVGARTNNWGNIHADLIWTAQKFITADNSSTYPVYATPEEGLRNIAQWLKNRWCKLSWQSSWNYVKWPRAPQTAWNKADINAYHWRITEVVNAYDRGGAIVIADTAQSRAEWDRLISHATDTTTKKKWIKDGCYFVKKIRKADYLQVDQNWEMKSRIDLWQKDGETLDVFNCYE